MGLKLIRVTLSRRNTLVITSQVKLVKISFCNETWTLKATLKKAKVSSQRKITTSIEISFRLIMQIPSRAVKAGALLARRVILKMTV